MMHELRPRPCASCPYRCDVAPGVWSADEYAKLTEYDGDTAYQSPTWFGCHSDDGQTVCAGWLGHRDPADLLGVRIGVSAGWLPPAACTYQTDVDLFATGAEAAAHGLSAIDEPGDETVSTVAKIVAARAARERRAQ
jgi:Family of unknown function (DUF6283)